MASPRSQLTRVIVFAGGLNRQRALLACAGYLGRDPMAQLQLRPGRANPYAVYDRLRASGPLTPTRLGNWVSTSHSAPGGRGGAALGSPGAAHWPGRAGIT